MRKLFAVLTLLWWASFATAQTQASASGQMKSVPDSAWRLFAVAPSGQVYVMEVGAGLQIDTSGPGGKPVLKVTLPVPTPYTEVRKVVIVAPGAAVQSYQLDHTLTPAQATRLKVYRNGVLQYEAIAGKGDYTLSGNTVTFLPVPWWDGTSLSAVGEGDALQFLYYL